MGFLKGLFGGREKSPPPPPSEKVLAIQDALRARVQPCLRLRPGGEGPSRLGGEPELTGEWPVWKGGPMVFVAQLDLAEMRTAGGPDWLPAAGRLLFFCEPGAWGSDPEDAGGALVRHELRWRRFSVQFGGLAKVGSGSDYAASLCSGLALSGASPG